MDLMYCRSREEELKKVTKVAEILSGKDNNKLPCNDSFTTHLQS